MIQISGLWRNVKDGKEYFTGYMGSARILIFPNGYKKEAKHPDYVMYIEENKNKEAKTAQAQAEKGWDDDVVRQDSPL